eukprot:Ihof_evm4s396 gene=Ihof_evmTU4s396
MLSVLIRRPTRVRPGIAAQLTGLLRPFCAAKFHTTHNVAISSEANPVAPKINDTGHDMEDMEIEANFSKILYARELYKTNRFAYHRFPISQIKFRMPTEPIGPHGNLGLGGNPSSFLRLVVNDQPLTHLTPFASVYFANLGRLGNQSLTQNLSKKQELEVDSPFVAHKTFTPVFQINENSICQDLTMSTYHLQCHEYLNYDMEQYLAWLEEIEDHYTQYLAKNINQFPQLWATFQDLGLGTDDLALQQFIKSQTVPMCDRARAIDPAKSVCPYDGMDKLKYLKFYHWINKDQWNQKPIPIYYLVDKRAVPVPPTAAYPIMPGDVVSAMVT